MAEPVLALEAHGFLEGDGGLSLCLDAQVATGRLEDGDRGAVLLGVVLGLNLDGFDGALLVLRNVEGLDLDVELQPAAAAVGSRVGAGGAGQMARHDVFLDGDAIAFLQSVELLVGGGDALHVDGEDARLNAFVDNLQCQFLTFFLGELFCLFLRGALGPKESQQGNDNDFLHAESNSFFV